jgi:N-acyl homoserine lactone hydrolase
MLKNQTVELPINKIPVNVHWVSTGSVRVKTWFTERTRNGLLAKLDFQMGTYTEWIPICVWVIDYREGILVIDTGENANVNDPKYFKASGLFANWFNTSLIKFEITREDEIDPQLSKLNIQSKDVKVAILTHLDLDHIDGLKYFPETRTIVNKHEWDDPYGVLPKLYPTWFKPELIDLVEKYETIDGAYFSK